MRPLRLIDSRDSQQYSNSWHVLEITEGSIWGALRNNKPTRHATFAVALLLPVASPEVLVVDFGAACQATGQTEQRGSGPSQGKGLSTGVQQHPHLLCGMHS